MIEINGTKVSVTRDDDIYVVARVDDGMVLFEIEAPMEGIDLLIELMRGV
jgi:hypothetical protein